MASQHLSCGPAGKDKLGQSEFPSERMKVLVMEAGKESIPRKREGELELGPWTVKAIQILSGTDAHREAMMLWETERPR